jgi:hypothetical protein
MKIFLFWATISFLATIYDPVTKEKIGGVEIPVKRKSAIMDTVVKLDNFRPELSKAIIIASLIIIPFYLVAQMAVLFIWPDSAINVQHPSTWPIYQTAISMLPKFLQTYAP